MGQDLHSFIEDENLSSSDVSSVSSSSLDFMEDATSSTSSSPTSDQISDGPLYEMSSLMAQLPFKRGLSKHFQGKSQSFTSLANVRCLEDLAKQENPCRKKLKSCKSYGGGLDSHHRSSYQTKACSKTISKKGSRGSCASLSAKKSCFFSSRPPVPPHRSRVEP